jgi:hypothetical protein
MFALAEPGRLNAMLEEAGFVDPVVEAVPIERSYPDPGPYLEETSELSPMFSAAVAGLDDSARDAVRARITELLDPFTGPDGGLLLPGRSVVAAASA